jgi:hypothetical protein
MPWRHMGEWMYRPTFSWPWHQLEVSGQVHTPGCFTPRKRAPSTYWIGRWMGPRAGLDNILKWKFLFPPGLELRPLGHPAHSQSLYWLRYPKSQSQFKCWFISHRLRGFSYSAAALWSGMQTTLSNRIITAENASMNHHVSKICLFPSFCPWG